jgi:hypothetical protein
MGPGYRCTQYELLPCDRDLQILSTIPQSVEPSTVSLRGVGTNWCGVRLLENIRSGANPALKGKPAQVSTVRTGKLVFSLNYERLGNRANVAGTGTSLCRLIGEWKIGSRTSPKWKRWE